MSEMPAVNTPSQYIYIGADHGGFALKQNLITWLQEQAIVVSDQGAYEPDPEDDYPLIAREVAQKLQQNSENYLQDPRFFGILLCRSGAGMAIVANKFQGIRAAVCRTKEEVRLARAHNNANVLVLEGDNVQEGDAQQFVADFLETPFEGGRHQRRLEQFSSLGEKKENTSDVA